MKILIPPTHSNHRLLDSGDGLRLEQFGSNTIIRPDSTCVWKQSQTGDRWSKASARCHKGPGGTWSWQATPQFNANWFYSFQVPITPDKKPHTIACTLRTSQSKNIGIFPEQASHWIWMNSLISKVPYSPTVLNLFGSTGAATLCAAASGAEVCHVDASKAAINWARSNQELSKLNNAPIRWIVDDCATFVAREIKREVRYDGLIIDPPAFGRDQKGKVFEFEKKIYQLLGLCKQVLKPKPLFVIFNGYAMGYSATILYNLLNDFFPKQSIEYGELHLVEHGGKRSLPCSIYARFTSF